MARFDIDALQAELAARGWTQVEAAEKAGVSENTFSLAARGEEIGAKTFYKIGLALEINPPLKSAARLLAKTEEAELAS